ncbi:MAG TPA: zinc ribbon domain-containing protein [Methylomirabilota bacterium]|nr:zinc ribbon domain-containing protein [Methylomirabilota bacterium]
MEVASLVCPHCSLPVLSEFYFCPNCGKQLRTKPLSLSLIQQMGIYLLSFFLPPFGLWPAFRYVRQSNQRTRVVGWIAIILTILSLIISTYYFMQFLQQFSQQLNQAMLGQ